MEGGPPCGTSKQSAMAFSTIPCDKKHSAMSLFNNFMWQKSLHAHIQVLISKEPTVAGRVAAHVAGLEDELGLLKQLDHPNIVRYLVRAPALTTYLLLLLANDFSLFFDVFFLVLPDDTQVGKTKAQCPTREF